MVTYDVVPEIESYLHSIGKTLHSGIDETEDTMAGRADNIGNSDDETPANEEEKKGSEEEVEEEEKRGRSRRR